MVTNATILECTASEMMAIGGAMICGANGLLIAYRRVNAPIATLVTMLMARGLGLIVSNDQAAGFADETFISIADTRMFGLPLPILVPGGCVVVFGAVFRRTTLAIGGNPEASRLARLNVDKIRVWIFPAAGRGSRAGRPNHWRSAAPSDVDFIQCGGTRSGGLAFPDSRHGRTASHR